MMITKGLQILSWFANQDLSQTYNSRSESETSDLSDHEDELEKTKTTSALSDSSDLINTTSDSELDLDFNPDPKPWKNLKPKLQSVLPESDIYTYLVECYQALPQHEFCGTPVAKTQIDANTDEDNEELQLPK